MNWSRLGERQKSAMASAIDRELELSVRRVNLIRFAGACGLLGLYAVLDLVLHQTEWGEGGVWIVAGYWAIAGALYVAGRRLGPRGSPLGLAIPLVDVPFIFVLLFSTMGTGSAAGTAGFAVGVFALFIILSAITLQRPLVIASAAVGSGLEIVLQMTAGVTEGAMVSTVMLLSLVAATCTYLMGRFRLLIEATARDQLRLDRMGRYFSPAVAELLSQAREQQALGESRELTVLFSDIRGFTSLAESMPSEAVVRLLNDYLTCMVDVIFAAGGTLDKFMGDGIMAYFGAPIEQPDHADRAMWCALHMREALRRFNLRREGIGGPPLKIGVALHSGRVIVGDIGSPRRREYTAIGDVVNVASRLEALTKQLASPIVVSESTRSRIRGPVRFVQAPKQPIRGRSGRIAVFLPEFDASVGVREGIWLRDHESIPELADAADSAGIDETLQSLAPAESSPWLAKKEVAAVGSS